MVNNYDYDSYGNFEVVVEGIANPYTYTGREFDAKSGLYFYRARFYDATTGRFTREDPLQFLSGDMNLYRYVGDNPINFIDPFGLVRCKCEATGGGLRDDRNEKTCTYSCRCDDCGESGGITIPFSAGTSDTAQCIGQSTNIFLPPGTANMTRFNSFDFDTDGLIDRLLTGPPNDFMDAVERKCTEGKC